MFLTVEHWYRPETIFFLATVCATPRSLHGMGKLQAKKDEYQSRYGARCWKTSPTCRCPLPRCGSM